MPDLLLIVADVHEDDELVSEAVHLGSGEVPAGGGDGGGHAGDYAALVLAAGGDDYVREVRVKL